MRDAPSAAQARKPSQVCHQLCAAMQGFTVSSEEVCMKLAGDGADDNNIHACMALANVGPVMSQEHPLVYVGLFTVKMVNLFCC